jgi:anamorsin
MKSVLVISNSVFDRSSDSLIGTSDEVKQVSVEESAAHLTAERFDAVFVLGLVPSDDMTGNVLNSLNSGGKLLIEVQDEASRQSLSLDLQIAGFVNITAEGPCDKYLSCEKASWGTGESASIKLPAASTWKMDMGDLAEEDLVDENDLLDDGLVVTPGAGCGVDASGAAGKKRACKNCSCGLAEIEAQEALGAGPDKAPEQPTKSSCGSCYKGDAFRCASCPFLGQPAFEPDANRVVLAAGTDDF